MTDKPSSWPPQPHRSLVARGLDNPLGGKGSLLENAVRVETPLSGDADQRDADCSASVDGLEENTVERAGVDTPVGGNG